MRKKLKKLVVLFLIITMIISSSACGKNKLSTEVLNVQIDAEVSSMDPQLATDSTSLEVIAAVTEGLYMLDATGNAVFAMADSVDESEDGLTYVFVLKDTVWSNGQNVTANDFVFAWRRLVDPQVGSENAFMASEAGINNADEIIEGKLAPEELGVTAVSDTVLQVQLEHPVAFFKSILALPSFYPVNQEFFESCGNRFGTSAKTINCNGAFKVNSYEPAAAAINLSKNNNYYDADNVQLFGVKFQVVKEAQQAMMAYERGDLDVINLSGEQVDKYKNSEDFSTITTTDLCYISPNQQVSGLENENLRKALALSFDKSAIVNNILKDGSREANFIIPYSLVTLSGGRDFRDTTNTYLSTDKTEADKYWKLAKQELGIKSATYTMLIEDTESAQNMAQFIQEEIQSTLTDMTIKLEVLPRKSKENRMRTGQYELSLTSTKAAYSDPLTFLDMFTTDNSNNFGLWSDTNYDSLIESCKIGDLSGDNTKRLDELKDAEKLAMEAAVIFPVYQKNNDVMIKNNVSGIEFHSVAINAIYKNVVKN